MELGQAAAEIMRRALQERVPVAPDAITHTIRESCIAPGSGKIRTPAEVLQTLVEKGIIYSNRAIERCLQQYEFNLKFRLSDAMTVNPGEGLVCWSGLL